MNPWQQSEGDPNPLGVTWIESEQAYNFSIYAKHATGMQLELFTDGQYDLPVVQIQLDPETNRSGRIWHIRIPQAQLNNAVYYAYRASGPLHPNRGYGLIRKNCYSILMQRAYFFRHNLTATCVLCQVRPWGVHRWELYLSLIAKRMIGQAM